MASAGENPSEIVEEAAASRRRGRTSSPRPHPVLPPLPPPAVSPAEPAEPKARRRRRRRRRGDSVGPQEAPAAEAGVEQGAGSGEPLGEHVAQGVPETAAPPPEAEPKVRRHRGGRRRRSGKAREVPAPAEVEAAVSAAQPQAKARKRRGRRRHKEEPEAAEGAAAVRRPLPPLRRARVPLTGAPTVEVPPPFAHPAEYEFARILDFYGIDWQYEPRSFPLRWEHGQVVEAFTPDFYLPDLNLYVELTTMKSGLTTEKNRKVRLLQEMYPEVNIKLLKKRDYLRLLAKYGYGPLSPDQVPDIDRVLITANRIQRRVGELGVQISHDYAGREPVLIGILRGVLCFMADLMRHISIPTTLDFMAISSYEGNGSGAVRILKDLDENIKGRDVILVEDIVDTGMTLNHVLEYLSTKKPASLKVCALLDKRARRIANVPLDYVGFEIPDEFVVGYGLDFRQRFRNLPFIAVLKHELLP